MCGATSRRFCGTVSGASAKLTTCIAGDVIVAAAEPLGDVAQRQEIQRLVRFARSSRSMRGKAPPWKMMLRCVSSAPLEGPVVPDV